MNAFGSGRSGIGYLVLLGVIVAGLHSADFLSDPMAAALIAVLAGIGAASALWQGFAPSGPSRRASIGAAAIAALAFAAVLVPIAVTLWPGSPIATGAMHKGEHLTLPENADGDVRLLVKEQFVEASEIDIRYRLSGVEPPAEGHLTQTKTVAQRSPGRTSVQSHVHASELVSGRIGGEHDIVVEDLGGDGSAPLEVSVFREPWPRRYQVALGLLLVLGVIGWSARERMSPREVGVAVSAVMFGILAYRWMTPGYALRPEIGAMVSALFFGLLAAGAWAFWLQRGRRPSSKTSISAE